MLRSRYVLALLCLGTLTVLAQEKKKAKLPGQYKRVHQKALDRITGGKSEESVAVMQEFLTNFPDDGETYYMLAVGHTALGEMDKAVAAVDQALKNGVPPGRFVGGTRTGLDALRQQPRLQTLATSLKSIPVHGPMLGDLTGTSAKVWLRTFVASQVQVVARTSATDKQLIRSARVGSTPESDFTAIATLNGLKPNTRYEYGVLIDAADDALPSEWHSFTTPVTKGQPAKFRIAFGGGAGYVPPNERAWTTIEKEHPLALLLLGDNVYSDAPKSPEMQHYCYYRRQSRPEFRSLVAGCGVYSIWDDHDFGTNDCSGGPEIETPNWKRPVWNVYRNNWVNPAYGGGEKQPGCWYEFYLGDVHFIMLDGRYYRTPGKSMLGPAQKQWLLDTLSGSQGKFKALVSPVPWVFDAKGNSKDTWNGFRDERDEIFSFLHEKKLEGVVLISADRHRSDLWKIERPAGYPLYEFNSSRLTNQHVHPTMRQAEFSYNKKQSFGTVDFDTTAEDPTVTYRIVTIDGEEVHRFTLKLSQLRE